MLGNLISIKAVLFLTLLLAVGINYWIANIPESEPIVLDMTYRPASVFVLGATGEVGKQIVKELAKNAQIEKVTLIGRRKVDLRSDLSYEKFTQEIVDFDKLSEHSEAFKGHDVGICSLGTTKGKSGTDGFYKVDHDYIVNSAKLAKDGGTKHFSLVSSGAANKNSYMFYLRVKGEVEEEITNMEFERVSIYRPGVLLCDRTDLEGRPGDGLLRGVFNCLDRWRLFSLETSTVATAIVRNIFNTNAKSVTILENTAIRDLGKTLK